MQSESEVCFDLAAGVGLEEINEIRVRAVTFVVCPVSTAVGGGYHVKKGPLLPPQHRYFVI